MLNSYTTASKIVDIVQDEISAMEFTYHTQSAINQRVSKFLETIFPTSFNPKASNKPKLYKLTNNKWVEGQYKSALMFGYNPNDVKRFHPDMQMEWIPEFEKYYTESWFATWCSPNDVIVEEYNINLNFPTISIEK